MTWTAVIHRADRNISSDEKNHYAKGDPALERLRAILPRERP